MWDKSCKAEPPSLLALARSGREMCPKTSGGNILRIDSFFTKWTVACEITQWIYFKRDKSPSLQCWPLCNFGFLCSEFLEEGLVVVVGGHLSLEQEDCGNSISSPWLDPECPWTLTMWNTSFPGLYYPVCNTNPWPLGVACREGQSSSATRETWVQIPALTLTAMRPEVSA